MIQVEVVSPQGMVYSGKVESVNVPTVEGEVGILETYGVLDVTPKKVLILAEEAYEIGKLPPADKLKEEFEKAAKKLATRSGRRSTKRSEHF